MLIDEYEDFCRTIRKATVDGLPEGDREVLREVAGRTRLGADLSRWYGALHDANYLLNLADDELENYIWPDPSEAVHCVLEALLMYVDELDLIPRKGE